MSIARRACLMLLCLLPLMAQAKSAEKTEEGGPDFEYIEMQPAFVVNFGTSGRIGYLKTEVKYVLNIDEIVAAVELHMPALRHELIMLLSGQSAEALAAPEQREALRLAALEAVRRVIATAAGDAAPAQSGVTDLLFTSFIRHASPAAGAALPPGAPACLPAPRPRHSGRAGRARRCDAPGAPPPAATSPRAARG